MGSSVNNLVIVKYLVSKSVDVNARDRSGDTPLHWAAGYNEDIDIVEFLVSQGSNIDARDNLGRTPLDLAREKGNKLAVEYLTRLSIPEAPVSPKDNNGTMGSNTPPLRLADPPISTPLTIDAVEQPENPPPPKVQPPINTLKEKERELKIVLLDLESAEREKQSEKAKELRFRRNQLRGEINSLKGR